MQLTNALCYALLTITMTATCIEAEGRRHEIEERKVDKRLSRQDTTVLIESMPIDRGVHKPKVVYRRVSKQRYGPKPKYGPPRSKYSSPKPSRKPTKKNRGKVSPKYGPPSSKKRPPKPRYTPSKRTVKPVYGSPKRKPHMSPPNSYHPEPMGFGEPPSNFDDHRSPTIDYDDFQKPGFEKFQKPGFNGFQNPGFTDFQKPVHNDFHRPGASDQYKPTSNDFQTPGFIDFHKLSFNDFQKPNFEGFQKTNFDDYPPKQGYGEPPVDSYGAPVKPNLHDLTYSTAAGFPDSTSHFDQDTFSSTLQSWKSLQQDQNIDNKYAFSNIPAFRKPESDVFVTPTSEDTEEELGLNSYSDIYNYRQLMKDKVKKKPYQHMKIISKPWKGNKKQVDDEVIVGGQYAEPPARYVPKFQPSAPMFPGDDEFAPIGHLSNPELVASATNSPYLNYKNSNMAFSPQNLNDAFSIINK